MRILILSFLLLFTSPIHVNSQIVNGCGFKVGLTSSNQLFDYSENFVLDDETYDYRYGLNLGLFAELFNVQYFSLIIDLSYNQKGMTDNTIATYVDTTSMGYSSRKLSLDRRLDYFTISTNIRTRYDFNNFSPYILTGFRYDIFLEMKIEKLFNGTGINKIAPDDFWENYKGNTFGYNIGIGIEIKNLVTFPIILEWVYNHDLSKIKFHENLEIQNISSELKIGMKF